MKTLFKILLPILALFYLQSFRLKISQDNVEHYELKQNEVISFGYGPDSKYKSISGSYRRGSYDGTSYSIQFDSEKRLIVSGMKGCKGQNQNELSLFLCYGNISRNGDTLKIHATTQLHKLYLFNIKKKGIVDTLNSDVQIDLVSKTLKNEYCPGLVSNKSDLGIIALPLNIKVDEIWKKKHDENSVGIFTYFSLKDSGGRIKKYPAGDYVIIGGNSVSITN